MTTKKAQKHINSFSTNFFGVVGYIASSLVWLLVFTTTLLVVPMADGVVEYAQTNQAPYITTIPGRTAGMDQSVNSPVFSFLLSILVIITFWAFAYFASRILSRVVRRVVGIFHKKITIGNLIKVKYCIHVSGVIVLTLLLWVFPGFVLISSLALFLGVFGLFTIWLQHRLSLRHRVPVEHVL